MDRPQPRPDGGSPGFAIIGAGAAGLMAADVLSAAGAGVTVYDHMPSPARKVLMAGRGGLNLTHSEPHARFLGRYTELPPQLAEALNAFTATETVAWVEGLGQPTFVGSSGRIFPKAMKASPLVRAVLARLAERGVALRLRHRWLGFGDAGAPLFETPERRIEIATPRATLLALGGASWPRLGSDGGWADILSKAGVAVVPFAPSNSGVLIGWSAHFANRFAGAPLKRIAITCGRQTVRGEALITRQGLQGGAVYALSSAVRASLAHGGSATITIDLVPDVPLSALQDRLSVDRKKQSLATFLRKATSLSPAAIALVHEAMHPPPSDAATLATVIKTVTLRIAGLEGLDRAISSAGGIAGDQYGADFQLKTLPGVYVAGEMLNWDAPTGGYLLQAAFASGAAAARAMLSAH